MKNIIIVVVVVATAMYFWNSHQLEAANPKVISNPVYAEVRMELDAQGRSFEEVILAETVDAADCQQYSKALQAKAMRQNENGLAWKLKSSECKAELESRAARFFENKRTEVSYLSLARGDRMEREVRVVYWGVTTDESDRVCAGVSQMQIERKGAVTCIPALRG